MKRYTANELEQIRRLSILEESEELEEPEVDSISTEEDEEIGFDPAELFASLRGEEDDAIEPRMEDSYIRRMLTGRGLLKLHGRTQPNKIFW